MKQVTFPTDQGNITVYADSIDSAFDQLTAETGKDVVIIGKIEYKQAYGMYKRVVKKSGVYWATMTTFTTDLEEALAWLGYWQGVDPEAQLKVVGNYTFN